MNAPDPQLPSGRPFDFSHVSLRRRLVLWLLIPLILASIFLLFESHDDIRRSTNQAYDRVLAGSALAIAERVVLDGGFLEVDVPYVALDMLTSAAQDRVFYAVLDADNTLVTGYANLPLPNDDIAEPTLGQPIFYDAIYRNNPIRVGMVQQLVSDVQETRRFTVLIAETTQARQALTQDLLTRSAVRLSLLIAAAGLIVWIGIGQGLKPLERLEQALKRRSPSDLRPILHIVPQEVRHLVTAINDLLSKLDQAFSVLQRFNANAAHQLRTPLTVMRTQTELALKESDPDKKQEILQNLDQTSAETARLAAQLLSLSHASQSLETGAGLSPQRLDQIIRDVTTKFVPNALAKQIDLGIEGDLPEVTIEGNRLLLEEMLKNLLDNALTYCRPGDFVTISLSHITDPTGQKSAQLTIADTGPGIPEAHRPRIFERFYRGDQQTGDGCGLGLAIVKEIVERHGGKIDLGSLDGDKTCGTVIKITLDRLAH